MTTFDTIGSRLDDSAATMFVELVETHLSAGGDSVFFRADSGGGTDLYFAGDGADRTWSGFDGGVLEDLVRYGLLSQSGARRREHYRIAADGRAFFGAPSEQVVDARRAAFTTAFICSQLADLACTPAVR